MRKDANKYKKSSIKIKTTFAKQIPAPYPKIVQTKNLVHGGRLVFELPEQAIEEVVLEGKKYNLELEKLKEIGNELFMFVMKKINYLIHE